MCAKVKLYTAAGYNYSTPISGKVVVLPSVQRTVINLLSWLIRTFFHSAIVPLKVIS